MPGSLGGCGARRVVCGLQEMPPWKQKRRDAPAGRPCAQEAFFSCFHSADASQHRPRSDPWPATVAARSRRSAAPANPMPGREAPAIGIDLGTTYRCAARALRPPAPRIRRRPDLRRAPLSRCLAACTVTLCPQAVQPAVGFAEGGRRRLGKGRARSLWNLADAAPPVSFFTPAVAWASGRMTAWRS